MRNEFLKYYWYILEIIIENIIDIYIIEIRYMFNYVCNVSM